MYVIKAPDKRLRVQTKKINKITPALLQTFKEMTALAKTFTDPEGVGLASTQIGLDGRFFVAKTFSKDNEEPKESFRICINPKIIFYSKKTKKYFEGCLSIPFFWGEAERSLSVKVSYMDETGKEIKTTLAGFDAHVFQHEVDHLDGILFVDKVLAQKGKMYKFTGKDETGTDIFEEMTI